MVDSKSIETTSLSGTFVITARLKNPCDLESVASLCEVLDHFINAFSLGMFSPAVLVSRSAADVREGGCQQIRIIDASNVELCVFGVLSGMLRYFDQIIAPLAYYKGEQQGCAMNILAGREKPMSMLVNLPFKYKVMLPKGSAPEFLVSVEFATPIPENERATYISEIRVWNALLQGGFAFNEDPIGVSGVGGSSTVFLGPYILHHHLDAWRASEASLAPLFNLMIRWHQRVGVAKVEVE